MKAASLVLFTLLAQTAVGAYWVLAGARALSRLALGVLLGLMAASLAASLFHLGTPLRAYGAVRHLGSSWVSREILAALVFAGLILGQAAAAWAELPLGQSPALAGLTALGGLALLYSMSRAYRLRTVPAWDSPATLLSFGATAGLLGGLLAGGLGAPAPAALGVVLAGGVVDLALNVRPRRPADPGRFGDIRQFGAWRGRPAALYAGLLGLGLAAGALALGAGWGPAALALAFGLAFAAKLVNRFEFYRWGLGR